MNDIIEIANQTSKEWLKEFPTTEETAHQVPKRFLEIFAKLVAAKEREACAKMVEDSWMAFARRSSRLDITPFPELTYVAKAIRARGKA
jgi:DNA phosphorothioation-dependent restriction protein DptG